MSGEFAYVPTRHLIHRRPTLHGFTLIELLVVITIIVVLLALLTPALDRAIYQAAMAVCAAKLHALAIGAQAYAVDSRRRYPNRPRHIAAPGSWWPGLLSAGAGVDDERPIMKRTVGNLSDLLIDPLCGKVDLETTVAASRVASSYQLWFGWKYQNQTGGLMRIGDRVVWQDAVGEHRFDLLASDGGILESPAGNMVLASHPDSDNVMPPVTYQDQFLGTAEVGGIGVNGGSYTFSRWDTRTTYKRGLLDLNFAFQDGAVDRLNAVKRGGEDDRLTQAPAYAANNNSWWAYLPAE